MIKFFVFVGKEVLLVDVIVRFEIGVGFKCFNIGVWGVFVYVCCCCLIIFLCLMWYYKGGNFIWYDVM